MYLYYNYTLCNVLAVSFRECAFFLEQLCLVVCYCWMVLRIAKAQRGPTNPLLLKPCFSYSESMTYHRSTKNDNSCNGTRIVPTKTLKVGILRGYIVAVGLICVGAGVKVSK